MAFSRDLKDFVAAFQAGYKMIPSQTDEEYKKAMTEYQRVLAEKARHEMNDPLELELKRAEIDKTRAYAKYYSRPDAGVRTYHGANSPEILTPEQEAQASGIMGGAIPDLSDPTVDSFADGGMVPMPERKPTMSAIPTPGATEEVTQGVTPPEPVEAPMEQPATPAGFSFLEAQDAVKGGYEDLYEQFKLNGAIDTPADPRGVEAMQKGVGAVDPAQLQEVDKAAGIDQLPEDRKNMARLARLWQFYQSQGMPNRAKAASAQLIQTYRMLHNRFDAIAKAAAEEGDVDGAIDAALRAYSYIPDGKTVKIKKQAEGQYAYSYVDDATGKEVAKAILSPDEILQAVTAHGMNSFDDLVLAAGDKEELARAKEERAAKRADAKDAKSAAPKPKELREFLNNSGASGEEDSPYRPLSKEEFDALPPGAWFLNPADGRKLKKAQKQVAAPATE